MILVNSIGTSWRFLKASFLNRHFRSLYPNIFIIHPYLLNDNIFLISARLLLVECWLTVIHHPPEYWRWLDRIGDKSTKEERVSSEKNHIFAIVCEREKLEECDDVESDGVRKKNDAAAGMKVEYDQARNSTLIYDQTDCSLMFIYILRLMRASIFTDGKERNERVAMRRCYIKRKRRQKV